MTLALLAVGTVVLGAVDVEMQGMVVNRKAAFLGNALLAFFDLGIEKLLHLAALQADEVIVVVNPPQAAP